MPVRALFLVGQAVLEKRMFENGGQRTDDGRTPENWYTISSPCELNTCFLHMQKTKAHISCTTTAGCSSLPR